MHVIVTLAQQLDVQCHTMTLQPQMSVTNTGTYTADLPPCERLAATPRQSQCSTPKIDIPSLAARSEARLSCLEQPCIIQGQAVFV